MHMTGQEILAYLNEVATKPVDRVYAHSRDQPGYATRR